MDDEFIRNQLTRSSAIADFRSARQKAKVLELYAFIQRKPINLLRFEEVREKLKANIAASKELKVIPLDAIVGSVNRYEDFTRNFLPRDNIDEERWANIVIASQKSTKIPPIEVYQIGEVYFVSDGHHRVSVARTYGKKAIRAYVTEVKSRVPLPPDTEPDDIILNAEYTNFLENTNLDHIRPSADLRVTSPGKYLILEEHIKVHMYYLGLEKKKEITYSEAVGHWYDTVYLPLIGVIRKLGLLRDFPNRTETDLYLWLHKYHAELSNKYGQDIGPSRAAFKLTSQFGNRIDQVIRRVTTKLGEYILPASIIDGPPSGSWRNEKLITHREDHLFSDILVPVNGSQGGWAALEQAILIASLEDASLHGLHVSNKRLIKNYPKAEEIQAEFAHRCRNAGVSGSLVVSAGVVAKKITEFASWNDLIIINLTYPPSPKPFAKLGSGFRTLLQRSPVPVLVVPQTVSHLNRVLIAYDDSPKSREALYIAAYLACQQEFSLVVFSATENEKSNPELQSNAREYLGSKHIDAEFLIKIGESGDLIVDTANEMNIDLILMGGYGLKPIFQAVLGSTVDKVLRESRKPVLICR